MKTARLCWAGLLAFTAAGSVIAAPYQQHLSSEAVREAFFLGRRMDEATADFLARYTKSFPIPKTGPNVARILVLTPYAQVVARATQDAGFSTPSDGEQEYQANANLLVVKIDIYSTPTYFLPVENLAEKFSIRVLQERTLKPQETKCFPLHSGFHGQTTGEIVELRCSVAQIHSAPITIKVSPPDGPRVEATFDLGRLR